MIFMYLRKNVPYRLRDVQGFCLINILDEYNIVIKLVI
jgi:hypothetical protein